MKKITIVGWYGTETIGDRAILTGLMSMLSSSFGTLEVFLGSLYPFYSQRMIHDDEGLYNQQIGQEIHISLFDSKNPRELDEAVTQSDLVVMGGGPLMHIQPLYMVDYAFRKAKKLKKPTAVLGCGIGPLFSLQYKKVLLSIIEHSNCVILRDSKSRDSIKDICRKLNYDLGNKEVLVSLDPALKCAWDFKNKGVSLPDEEFYLSVNYRSFPGGYSRKDLSQRINEEIINFTKLLARKNPDYPVYLTPMHYFSVGTDDRIFLNYVKEKCNCSNLVVQNEPLTLAGTMEIFSHSSFNVGMRFHSVLLQTVLSGKNIILDYTEPGKGKINGFIQMIDSSGFYKKRYVNLQESSLSLEKMDLDFSNGKFELEAKMIDRMTDLYKKALGNLA